MDSDSNIYSNCDKEVLEWELSLSSSDLRAHAWYHGNLPRNVAEHILEEDGEFLVRDSSTFARSGDYVLSTKWHGVVLHFLIQKEVLQPDTIYEQIGYRFEQESFTTVPDLITYYVGNKDPISARSGAIISLPRNRTVPISRKGTNPIRSEASSEHADYISLAQQAIPVEALIIDSAYTPEGPFQVSLNLKPPPGLLEELEDIPDKIRELEQYKTSVSFSNEVSNRSNFDLSTFSSILLPMNLEEVVMNPTLIEEINTRIMEVSCRIMAIHITEIDWKVLNQEPLRDGSPDEEHSNNGSTNSEFKGMFERMLNDTQFRWNHIIERSFTFSHFVVMTVLGAQERETMLDKWVGIAKELKTSMGNFFSFCNIMRGLLNTKITTADGPVDWFKLRREYTESAFLFETNLRQCYYSLLKGTESYPPNTTIPNLFPASIILEDCADQFFPTVFNAPEPEKLQLTVAHLRQLYLCSDNEGIYRRNWERFQESSNVSHDLILMDICRTETHLLLLWGTQYQAIDLIERCKHYEDL